MLSAQVIANLIIRLSLEEDVVITPVRLQKILYATYCHHYTKARKTKLEDPTKFFPAKFFAWKTGPVCEEIYLEFKPFENKRITEYSQDATGNEYIINIKEPEYRTFRKVLNQVWSNYKNVSTRELIEKTTADKTAWSKSRTNQLIKTSFMKQDAKEGRI